MNIYLTEPGMILKKDGGKYIIEKDDIVIKEVPLELIENVNIYSGATVTSKCIQNLIEKPSVLY
ncbi:MAG: CRISPR-associated endonuclease Cas1 [Lachnospiraceae bacterium]|jgi:CRISPR/Cas system-associated endonuclease Cas1|nr:CRISPR-associated endonuclease Cas1 [Lachnospiraceae bacterium]